MRTDRGAGHDASQKTYRGMELKAGCIQNAIDHWEVRTMHTDRGTAMKQARSQIIHGVGHISECHRQ